MAQVKPIKLNGADFQQTSASDDVTFNTYTIGSGGNILKNSSGVTELRNSADNAYAPLRVSEIFIDGTVTEIEKESIVVESNFITLNVNETGTPSEDAYFEIERGTSANAQLYWNESTDRFQAGVAGSLSNIILATSTDLDSRYFTETELGSSTSSSGSDLIGDDDTYSNFNPTAATVKGALAGIDSALGSISVSSAETLQYTFTAGATVGQYKAVYVAADGDVEHADADALATSRVVGITTVSGDATDPITVVLAGILEGAVSGFTPGDPIFLSTTAGDLTQTAPSGSADCIVEVGLALTSTDILVRISKPVVLS